MIGNHYSMTTLSCLYRCAWVLWDTTQSIRLVVDGYCSIFLSLDGTDIRGTSSPLAGHREAELPLAYAIIILANVHSLLARLPLTHGSSGVGKKR